MCVAKSPIFAAPTVTVTPVVNFDEKLPIPALQRTSRVSPWQNTDAAHRMTHGRILPARELTGPPPMTGLSSSCLKNEANFGVHSDRRNTAHGLDIEL